MKRMIMVLVLIPLFSINSCHTASSLERHMALTKIEPGQQVIAVEDPVPLEGLPGMIFAVVVVEDEYGERFEVSVYRSERVKKGQAFTVYAVPVSEKMYWNARAMVH